MRPEPQTYEDLIASLADGTPVDWAGLEAGVNDEQKRRRYQNLRLVARVADLHRTLSQDDSGIALDVAATEPEIPDRAWTWGHLEVRGRLASGAFGEFVPRPRPAARSRCRTEAASPSPRRDDHRPVCCPKRERWHGSRTRTS